MNSPFPHIPSITQNSASVYIEAYSSQNLLITERTKQWCEAGYSSLQVVKNYTATSKDLRKFMLANFWNKADYQVHEFSDGEWVVLGDDLILTTKIESGVVKATIRTQTLVDIERYENMFSDSFEPCGNFIQWLYSSEGHTLSVPLTATRLPITEMYPFLNGESLEDYYSRFLESTASIILLIGPPGTGKTTFIRGLIEHANTNALVTYDVNLLDRDYVFAQFVESDDVGMMIFEDSDNFLRARTDGNGMMHRFLNVGDGLVSTARKKMVFSTNLPSVRDIDPALVRPGRCFDIVNFGNLTTDQAAVVARKIGTPLPTCANSNGEYSLAEIFHEKSQGTVNALKQKIGF